MAGVDGCRAGWVVVLHDLVVGTQLARVVPNFHAVLAVPETPAVIAVDVPIGLLASAGGRACEGLARRVLRTRASSTEANAGAPMAYSKKRVASRSERAALLENLGFVSPLQLLGPKLPKGVTLDDLLDACIACWTAERVAAGTVIVTPMPPPLDAHGLRMELWR